jgi:cellobiose dehydrogenase (acceptor)
MSYYLTTASDTGEYCTDTASMAGCLLGGGTMVNALMFVRPQEIDFNDKWPAGWKWSDVSASADKLYERNPGTTLPSKDGQRYDQAAFSTLSSFFSGIGFNEVDAIKEPNQKTKVFSYPPWSIADGLRASPLTSYYPLAQAMADFKLSLNTKVIRAVRTGSTITGVEVETSIGARQIINLNTYGKVILASGAMSTPRILFNSGIGPAAQITTVKNGCSGVTLPDQANWIDLPVGKNLKDHPIFTLTFNTKSNGANSTSLLAADFTSPSQTNIDLFAQGNGPLVQSGQRLVFWSSLETTNGTRYFQGTCNSPAAGQMRMKVYLTHGATSSGVLGITSQGATEFTTQPLMNTDEDKAAVVTFLDRIINAAKNSTVLSLNDSTMSGASIVSNYVTGDHFVGTTIMGTANDGSAVVDTDTKVFGTDNLFVVDASIHPDLVSSLTLIPPSSHHTWQTKN